jgi:hypothetical protein
MKNVYLGRGLTLALPFLALCAMIVSGCSSGESYDVKTAGAGLPRLDPKRADLVTAELKMRVPNVQKSEREIGRILQTAGGYIETASSGDLGSRYPTMALTLKIPVTNVATALDSLESLGTPTAKSVSMQDVTDSAAGTSARPVKPPLSTVNLSLEQSVAAEVARDPEWLGPAWEDARLNAMVVYRTLFVGLIWLLAFLPVWLPGAWLYWKYGHRLKRPPVAA